MMKKVIVIIVKDVYINLEIKQVLIIIKINVLKI
jgi:hypothetical protein